MTKVKKELTDEDYRQIRIGLRKVDKELQKFGHRRAKEMLAKVKVLIMRSLGVLSSVPEELGEYSYFLNCWKDRHDMTDNDCEMVPLEKKEGEEEEEVDSDDNDEPKGIDHDADETELLDLRAETETTSIHEGEPETNP